MHPNLMERRAEEIKRRTETREVGGDLSVLTRKDDFYQPVACLLALAAFASFVVSITIIETYITPATDNLDLALRDCSVHLVGVVDKDRVPLTDWTVQSGLPFPTKEEIGHGVLSCWHKCEKEDGACGNVVAERGYGYCVQLNVTFPVEQSVKADSLVTSDSVSSDNASNATDGIACSGNCTNATDASGPASPPPLSPPPAPSAPTGNVDLVINETCPVVMANFDMAKNFYTASLAASALDIAVHYSPATYPGFTLGSWPDKSDGKQKQLFKQYYELYELSPPYNDSYVIPWFGTCDSIVEDGAQGKQLSVHKGTGVAALDGEPVEGYTCAKPKNPNAGASTAAPGDQPGQYMTTSCTIVDCRGTVAEATQALEVIMRTYQQPPYNTFECETLEPSKASTDKLISANALLADGSENSVYPAFAEREWTYLELVLFSVLVAGQTSFCYALCYFFCCREWWCQAGVRCVPAAVRKLQYF